MNDTIAAISSSGGPIGLIRVSGERAIEAINAVFQAKNGKPLTEAPSQKLVYGTLTDKSGNVIDCCYAVALHAPHTYTGETMAELQCHGSTAVLCAGLDALFAQGVRQAEAGEFTRRAFLNGKMGLSEAEAVHDLITARTAEAAQNAAAQVMGAVGSPVQQMRDELLGMVAHFHAVVDFPDEDIDPVLFEDAAALLGQNRDRFALENLQVVCGSAPEACVGLPAPTHAFIGGSAGNMHEIVALLLAKNPRVRIVATAVSLESVAELTDCLTAFPFAQTEVVSLQAARDRKAGSYHLMSGQNPIYIFTMQGGGETA